jgi:hypothetical protein
MFLFSSPICPIRRQFYVPKTADFFALPEFSLPASTFGCGKEKLNGNQYKQSEYKEFQNRKALACIQFIFIIFEHILDAMSPLNEKYKYKKKLYFGIASNSRLWMSNNAFVLCIYIHNSIKL